MVSPNYELLIVAFFSQRMEHCISLFHGPVNYVAHALHVLAAESAKSPVTYNIEHVVISQHTLGGSYNEPFAALASAPFHRNNLAPGKPVSQSGQAGKHVDLSHYDHCRGQSSA